MAPSPRKRRRLDPPATLGLGAPPSRSPRRKASVNMELDDAAPARRLRTHALRGSSTSSSTSTRRRGPQRRASAPTSTEDEETDAGERRQRAVRIGKTPTRERVPLSPVKADRPPLPRTPRARAGARPRTRSFEVMHDSPPQMRKRKRLSTSDESSSDEEPDDDGSMDLDSRTPVPRRTRSGGVHLRDRIGPPRFDSRATSDRSSLSPDENRDDDDAFYLRRAPSWQLHRLRKDKLVELLVETPLGSVASDDGDSSDGAAADELEELTKDALVAKILSARGDGATANGADDEADDDAEADESSQRRSSRRSDTADSPTRAFSALTLATPRRTHHVRSQSMPTLTDLTRATRARTRNSNDAHDDHRLRNGKARGIGLGSPRMITRRVTFDAGEADESDHDMASDGDRARYDMDATPRPRRTRSMSRSTVSGDESDGGQRRLRNGKVVALPVEDESAVVSDDEEDQEDEAGAIDLSSATSKSLLRFRRDDLVRLCQERDLDDAGTKKDLIQTLLDWRRESSGARSSSSSDPSSTSSTATLRRSLVQARNETKTQALADIDDSVPPNTRKPLLLDPHRPARSPTKPDTPSEEGGSDEEEEEEEEVAALDLESLNLQDKAIAPDRLKRGEKIGSGGFKDVYAGKFRNVKVAIADLRGTLTEADIRELSLLRDLRHDNIVRFIGVSVADDPRATGVPCSLVTELCLNGDLFDYLRSGRTPPTFDKAVGIMLDITRGVEYLHTRDPATIHRDIKSSNVLITARGVAKIADFGLARVRTSTHSVVRSLVGTVNWQAPELWSPKPSYNESVDVYATGLVLWEILSWHESVKRYPFEELANEFAIFESVGKQRLRPATAHLGRKWTTCPAPVFASLVKLMERMWAHQSSVRPCATAAIAELVAIRAAAKARS